MVKTKNTKENFYVFLDFDGVLYDIEYLIMNKIKNNEKLFRYAPDSIEALNKLFSNLSTKFNPHLVISSFWRMKFPMTVRLLKDQGFDIVGVPLMKTKISNKPMKRGLEIKDFLEEHDNSDNYIIIDDTSFDYAKHFPKEKIVKTHILNDRLTEDKLDTALSLYGIKPLTLGMEK